jgi:hypothetical protein
LPAGNQYTINKMQFPADTGALAAAIAQTAEKRF